MLRSNPSLRTRGGRSSLIAPPARPLPQVIKHNTTYDDALRGRSPKNGEVSLRIRREAAGRVSEQELRRGLEAVACACQASAGPPPATLVCGQGKFSICGQGKSNSCQGLRRWAAGVAQALRPRI
jgi:hypothetical protein